MPILSVVMSVFNGEKYLHKAINSILEQSFHDFEFIIIDDCSTDNTGKILESFCQKDNRIKIIRKNENKGLTGFIENLNLGISKSKGKYIARMDADDISLEDRFQKQIDFLESNPEVSMVGAQINFINEKDEIIGEKFGALQNNEIVQKITSVIQLFHPVIMFRNFENIQYRTKFLYCEDYDLYLNLITQGKKLANLNEKLLNYRILETSISREGDNFIKKLMVEKSIYFYHLRNKLGDDCYENFDNKEILEINNINFLNSKKELIFAMESAIKLNKKSNLKFLINKFSKQYPKDNIPFKYIIISRSPFFMFKFLKKIYNKNFSS